MSKRSILNVILLIIARGLLDLAYINYVAPLFGYEGFNLAPDASQYLISWVLYASTIPLAPSGLTKVSDAIFSLVIVSVMAPLTSMYGLSGESILPVIFSEVSLFLVYMIANARLVKVLRVPTIRNSELLAVIISLTAIIVVALHYLITGVHLSASLIKVYDFRRANEELAGTGLFSYLNPWVYEAFNLFLIALCFMKRRYGFAAILFVVQLFFFMASQQKSVLFTPWLILGVWWYLHKSNNLLIIPLSICALISLSLGVYLFFGNVIFPSIAIRRLFFIPAHLDFAYYSFFSTHAKIIWGDSFWMPFAHSPYNVSMSYVIGGYLNSPDMHANNGYVSSGFGQAGLFGIFIYTLILGYTLKFVDSESRRLEAPWFGVSLFLLPFMTIWLSSDLTTSLFTHGFLIMLMLLSMLHRPGKHIHPENIDLRATFERSVNFERLN